MFYYKIFSVVKSTPIDTICGPNWVKYADEKCYRLVKQLVSWNDAANICESINGALNQTVTTANKTILATIKSEEEQAFIQKWLYEKELIHDFVWLGANRTYSFQFRYFFNFDF